MNSTLIGVFDDRTKAERAREALLSDGFPARDVALRHEGTPPSGPPEGTLERGSTGFGAWLRSLFLADDVHGYIGAYSEAARRGHVLLTVDAEDAESFDRAATIMERCGSIDIDEHASQWRREGWTSAPAADAPATGRDAGAAVGKTPDGARADVPGATAGGTIPVVAERLQVGTRQVLQGGVRVFSRVVERPVEETVRLREEHVDVQRRPVDRPATPADLDATRQGSLELRETVEEPVVRKSARVVEEVDVGKTATERTETVRDKVRRTEVDVERLGEDAAMARGKPATGKKRPR
jgi:stress response protein YsnF